jgi:hypothetical protein
MSTGRSTEKKFRKRARLGRASSVFRSVSRIAATMSWAASSWTLRRVLLDVVAPWGLPGRESGPVPVTTSGSQRARASRSATVRAQAGLCRARARLTASSTRCWATSASLRCSPWLIARN